MSKWELEEDGRYIHIVCPVCGYVRVREYAYNYKIFDIPREEVEDFIDNNNLNFCEKCGTKMKMESEEEE